MKQKDYKKELTACGLKNTRQRTEILSILDHSNQPVAAEDVYLSLKDSGVPVNLSTVYRTLETLADRGLATKVTVSGENRALYEFNRQVHRHYLVCLDCKSITPVESCPLEDYEKKLSRETDFMITGHRLDIYGYCPKCRANHQQGD